jgi:hypothetical protein
MFSSLNAALARARQQDLLDAAARHRHHADGVSSRRASRRAVKIAHRRPRLHRPVSDAPVEDAGGPQRVLRRGPRRQPPRDSVPELLSTSTRSICFSYRVKRAVSVEVRLMRRRGGLTRTPERTLWTCAERWASATRTCYPRIAGSLLVAASGSAAD